MRRYMYDFILSPDQTPLSKTQKMKYLKPLALYQQLMKTNANNQCHRLFGLEMRDKYLNLAVSNPVNTIAAPLWQENDTGLMVDKLRTLLFYFKVLINLWSMSFFNFISEHNAVGFVVCYPYHLFYSKAKGKEVKNFVDDLCKTKKMEGLMYTYWDNLITLKDMDFALDHNVGFICQQLNLPEDVSKKIMDRFYAAQVLQGYINWADKMLRVGMHVWGMGMGMDIGPPISIPISTS
ncbi:hypothetical protein Ddye_015112 [Dipteronia dyeriana]|uniref:Uncharacterized protein n=1 Tax=Dipteronia dyeriana TaxID=168575 RepID=A0AAD9U4X1_9ROSI|nr:hypothetical protein Ddye_015112 [Dipteronia dyeriana]